MMEKTYGVTRKSNTKYIKMFRDQISRIRELQDQRALQLEYQQERSQTLSPMNNKYTLASDQMYIQDNFSGSTNPSALHRDHYVPLHPAPSALSIGTDQRSNQFSIRNKKAGFSTLQVNREAERSKSQMKIDQGPVEVVIQNTDSSMWSIDYGRPGQKNRYLIPI